MAASVLRVALQREWKDVDDMGAENGWRVLLENSSFAHMEDDINCDDARRLLAVIGEEFYSKVPIDTIDIWDRQWAVPERQDTVGYKAHKLEEYFGGWLQGSPPPKEEEGQTASEASEWLNRFLTDHKFRSYVFSLLQILSRCAQKALPSRPQTTSYAEREQDTAQANAEELEDEVGKAAAARESAEAAKKAADSAKETADSIMPNMLTTLGVFIAIVIAVVACYLSLILSKIYGISSGSSGMINIVIILLMGHILLNVIFLLLYLISKMSAHTLACHCLVGDQADCLKCSPELRARCRFRHKLWLRYPYVVAMNGVFVATYCGLGLWYLVRRYFGADINAALVGSRLYAAILIGVVAVLMIGATVFVFQIFLRSPRHILEAEQKKGQQKAKSVQKKEQKAEKERRPIRKLREKLDQQNNRLTELEETIDQMKVQLAQYQAEHDDASVK